MMARSTNRSNQRPDTLMQDRKAARSTKPLATHGRTIHLGHEEKNSTLANVFCCTLITGSRRRSRSLPGRAHIRPQLRCRTAGATWRLALDEVDEGAQRCRQVTAAGIIEKRPRKALPPWFEHGDQRTVVERSH